MTKKATLSPITGSPVSQIAAINSALDDINDKLDNTVSRDGSTPNNMLADLDMDSNDLLNVNAGHFNQVFVGGIPLPVPTGSTVYWGTTVAGTSDAIEVSTTPSVTSIRAGDRLVFKTSSSLNTASNPTINFNGLGAVIAKDKHGVVILKGQLKPSTVHCFMYDGTNWIAQVEVPRWLSPSQFGATGDGSTDDGTAIQACHDAWLNVLGGDGGILWYPGTYYTTKPAFSDAVVDALASVSGVSHMSQRSFAGLGTVRIKPQYTPRGTRTAGLLNGLVADIPFFECCTGSKQVIYNFDGLEFEGAEDDTLDPIPLKAVNWNQSVLDNIRISLFKNTGLHMESINNTRSVNVTVRHCGFQPTGENSSGFLADGVTFNLSNATTTLTASANVFSSSDVGKWIFIYASGTVVHVTTIASYTAANEVELTDAATDDYVDAYGSFGIVKGSISSSDGTLTLDSNCVPAGFEGALVHVMNAGYEDTSGSGGFNRSEMKLLSARISTRTSASEVELAHNARSTVSDVPVIFMPQVFIGFSADTWSFAGHNNDFQCYGWRVEASGAADRGVVGMVASQVLDSYWVQSKIHGIPPTYANFAGNMSLLLADNCKHIHFTSCMYTWGCYSAEYAQRTVTGARSCLYDIGPSFGDPVAYLKFAFWAIDPSNVDDCKIIVNGGYNNYTSMTVDANTMYYRLLGSATFQKNIDQVGGIKQRGNPLSYYPSSSTTYTPTVTFGGTEISTAGGAYTTQTGRYERFGNQVWFFVNVTLSAKGTATGRMDISLPVDTSVGYAFSVSNWSGFTGLNGALQGSSLGNDFKLLQPGGGGGGSVDITDADVTNTMSVRVSGWYEAA